MKNFKDIGEVIPVAQLLPLSGTGEFGYDFPPVACNLALYTQGILLIFVGMIGNTEPVFSLSFNGAAPSTVELQPLPQSTATQKWYSLEAIPLGAKTIKLVYNVVKDLQGESWAFATQAFLVLAHSVLQQPLNLNFYGQLIFPQIDQGQG